MYQINNKNRHEAEDFIENDELKCPTLDTLMQKRTEWDIIDNLVFQYQGKTVEAELEVADPAQELLDRFQPLFKKYIILIKTAQINWENMEQKLFVSLFISDMSLKKALYSGKITDKNIKNAIYQRFNFVKETYGYLEDDEILTDLYIILLTLARRYKPLKRSFCAYVFNTFRYEVFRTIQRFTRNPANIHYKNISFEQCVEENNWEFADESAPEFEECLGIDEGGMPNFLWVQGSCSEAFQILTPLERKILAKYYLEHYNDKQIANEFKLHVNTCNQKRHQALEKLANYLGLSKEDIKRSRNSGRRGK